MDSSKYKMWLQYEICTVEQVNVQYQSLLRNVVIKGNDPIIFSAKDELQRAVKGMLDHELSWTENVQEANFVIGNINEVADFLKEEQRQLLTDLTEEGYIVQTSNQKTYIVGNTDKGVLYGVHHFIRLMQINSDLSQLQIVEQPKNQFRMINQWDNLDGTVERGYSGQSIFYQNGKIVKDKKRIRDYARYLSSVGINAISINNVNVWEEETYFITNKYLAEIKAIADIFSAYAIRLYLSINFASPMAIDGLSTADPLNKEVKQWWKEKVAEIYEYIPDFGGFVVKADSEHRPGPFTYNRDHADGANMLAEALEPYDGKVVWRCFVYNCLQDWRDRATDRARAAYDHFKPLDGRFHENVLLQIKNGPMDFQVREPVSPLLGAMPQTNQLVEFQVAQEYTGQQIDLCYLIPQWKQVLDFDTHIKGTGSTISEIVAGNIHAYKYSGIAAVSNIGDDENWTGHTLAQANLYGYGRLIWDPSLSSQEIAEEWISQTFGNQKEVVEKIGSMLLSSWTIYENYTAPLGVGWMVTPGIHYGPNIDGYEYSRWGTYHFADREGIGVDRTIETGTGYTDQYEEPNRSIYNILSECPDELLLFFHHVPYKYTLKNGETVIQHIYNTHFKGYEQVEDLMDSWNSLESLMDNDRFKNVQDRFRRQKINAKEWRDQINSYFYRKSGIADQYNRTIY
ncbi:alpha-glucuronidase family glycosyl hydrolase [Gracilibacillus salinarum]|uniref:Xylan alpha-1,2-glucuronidase n=1 Tax=Gracilibacillus salinarum TaxID=2932255 RepID=A0ABY4GL42_9BACI|nr:alpha-glucuronidase family glycosyl hydrolase [Gracilibacillus salinarum]UOQ85090.1 alpha-glucuronidase [Gracilibacillus salinarum]